MKAYVLHGINKLRYEDYPLPELSKGWVRLRVLAAGICSSDVPRIFQNGAYHFPTIPGHEFCGVVGAVSDEKDRALIGKRAGVFPLIPCKKCPSCEKGNYELCAHYDYLGSRRDGGFAEYVAVPAWNLIELPDTVSNVQGAMLEPASVALHAVKRASICEGMKVCIVGTGAVGFLAGQWAKIYGADVVMMGRNENKRYIAEGCGLEYCANVNRNEGFDCVIEAVGTAEAFSESIALAAPGGKLVLLGNPDADRLIERDCYWKILRKQLTLLGTWNSSFGSKNSDWIESIQNIQSGKLQTEPLISHLLKHDELYKGLGIMRDKIEPYCKLILSWDL